MIRSTVRRRAIACVCFVAAALLLGPAGLGAQWLQYVGTIEGRFTATCATSKGNAPQSGDVTFIFRASADIGVFWGPISSGGRVADDGSANGKGDLFTGAINWQGRFTRGADGSIHGTGSISERAGEVGCKGTWSADKAADATPPSQPLAPTGESPVCAKYRTSIKRVDDEVNGILSKYAVSSRDGEKNPWLELEYARSDVQEISRDITGLKKGTIAVGSPKMIEAREEDRSMLYARINQIKAIIQQIEGKKNDIRRLQSEAKAAGCTSGVEPVSPRTGVDNAIDELLELDSNPSERIIGVAGVEGIVEVESQSSKGPLTGGTRIPLDKPTTIRTGPGSSVTIQVGSVRKTLQANTTVRIVPKVNGQPDFIEQGGATVDVRKPGPNEFKTPTATAKVGGTVFTVSYDPTTRVTGVMVEEGRVAVQPNSGVRGVTLAPGEYVEVGSNSMTAVLPAPGAPATNVGGISPRSNPAGNPAASPQGVDLTGLWKDDTGGGAVYHMRQVGNRVYWIVDGTPMGSFVNLAYGEISGNIFTGIWVDLPGSPSLGGGNLSLRIESNDRFTKVSSNPYYGAQAWTRQGSTGAVIPPSSGGGSEIWRYESDGGWSGTWIRRGTTDVFDSKIQATGSPQQNIVEKVTIEGRRFHSERLQSSDGNLCLLDGALDSDNRTYRGTGSCPGGPSGWQWTLIRPTASAGLIRAAPSPSDTRVWHYQSEGGWTGTWTRRGTSNLYDSELYGANGEHQIIVERITFDGARLNAQRIQSSDGKLCTLEGTLQADGQTYQGTAQCPGGPNGWWWRIRP